MYTQIGRKLCFQVKSRPFLRVSLKFCLLLAVLLTLSETQVSSRVRAALSIPIHGVSTPADALDQPDSTQSLPLENLLNQDGTLNLGTGFSGSLDATGWQMVTDSNGQPRFLPANTSLPAGSADLDDVYWDDRFGIVGSPVRVSALAVNGRDVYVGGTDSQLQLNNIAKWDGNSWSPLGEGVDGIVHAIAVGGSGVYVGGTFITATDAGGAKTVNHIARWDGNGWSPLGEGVNGAVYAIAVDATEEVYVGGRFTEATDSGGAQSVNNIVRWGAGGWETLGQGVSGEVRAISISGDRVYVGGSFLWALDEMGTPITVNSIARWWNFDSSWSPLGEGVDGGVSAIAATTTNVYVGGFFDTATDDAGTTTVNGIASWNPSSEHWSSLGSGLPSGWVESIALDGGSVYIGGNFATVGGVPASHVARWSGSSWSALGEGVEAKVNALGVADGALYVGGDFISGTDARGTHALNGIARWEEDQWHVFAPGFDFNGSVNALAVSGNTLYAGGTFTMTSGITVNHVAQWSGRRWTALGQGVDGEVRALAVSGSDLYVGGAFLTARDEGGAKTVNHIARWDGAAWQALGSGVSGQFSGSGGTAVNAIAINGNDVYVGGTFTTATDANGSSDVRGIAVWDGSGWSAIGGGVNDPVYALAVSGGEVYVGGDFLTVFDDDGTEVIPYLARWDGGNWSSVGSGPNRAVRTMALDGNDLYVGGAFDSIGGQPANHIARWNGATWSALDGGLDGTVEALTLWGDDLYVGGAFTQTHTITTHHVARWDGVNWSSLGEGLNATVQAVAVRNGEVFAGGAFDATGSVTDTRPLNGVARWDGAGWTPVAAGGGANQFVSAILVDGRDDVYVGGAFSTVGYITAHNIARWDGSRWNALGEGVNFQVFALAVLEQELYVGGSDDFRVAWSKWNGSAWTDLPGGMEGEIRALAPAGQDLYVGGSFEQLTDGSVVKTVNNIARWEGSSWSALDNNETGGVGVDGSVNALVIRGDGVYVGGDFQVVIQAPNMYATNIARWDNSRWSGLSSDMKSNGLDGPVYALSTRGDALYIGGDFSEAFVVHELSVETWEVENVARWQGGWFALGDGVNDWVFALAVHGNDVYAGGLFDMAGGVEANYIAQWDGDTWSALGSGVGGRGALTNVGALAAGCGLFVGGDFTKAGEQLSLNFAGWNEFDCAVRVYLPLIVRN